MWRRSSRGRESRFDTMATQSQWSTQYGLKRMPIYHINRTLQKQREIHCCGSSAAKMHMSATVQGTVNLSLR